MARRMLSVEMSSDGREIEIISKTLDENGLIGGMSFTTREAVMVARKILRLADGIKV